MVDSVGNMDVILQSCIDMMLGGQAQLETVVSNHPERADELRPLLTSALWLWSNRSVFDPRPEFLKSSHKRLVALID